MIPNKFLGVFVAKGDVGIGTIVGSAVFNILVIIGLCALLCDKVRFKKLGFIKLEYPKIFKILFSLRN